MTRAYEAVLTGNLTVAQTEELIREMLHHVKTEGEMLTNEEKKQFEVSLPTEIKLKIIQTRIKSKLIFETKGSLAETTKAVRLLMGRLGL